MRIEKKGLLCGLLLLAAAIPLPGLLASLSVSPRAEFEERPSSSREYRTITRHLRGRFDGYGTLDVLQPQFGIVALSHMASGLLNVYVAEPDRVAEVHESLVEVATRALSAPISPTHSSTRSSTPLDDHNLFWSHLGLILGIERYVRCGKAACPPATDADRLSEPRSVTQFSEWEAFASGRRGETGAPISTRGPSCSGSASRRRGSG